MTVLESWLLVLMVMLSVLLVASFIAMSVPSRPRRGRVSYLDAQGAEPLSHVRTTRLYDWQREDVFAAWEIESPSSF